ncbi:MAG TPA: response regulator transcription factor [Gammaproteobacteria bacterium]|nr:response regulator transcription factor [Gammaproteobacteria bacterium]
MRVLLLEDDAQTASQIRLHLEAQGHRVRHIGDGVEGLSAARSPEHDVLVVDRMLPSLDGLSVIRDVRREGVTTPALVLSALAEVDDRVAGLRAGGDDYLVKPFALSELTARLEALVRRAWPAAAGTLRVRDLELEPTSRRVTRAGQRLRLQPRELRLLEYLMRHAGRTVTRSMLLEQVWELQFDPQTNVVDSQISRLRTKIDRDFDPPLLHTIRGVGYRLGEPD